MRYLHQIGLASELVALIKDYLREKTLSYSTNMSSAEKNLTKGCPQESVLGPLLWNLTWNLCYLAKTRNPVVNYRGRALARVDKTKYLGLVLDEKLGFVPHMEYITEKASAIFQSLRHYAWRNWSSTADSLSAIYQKAILPIAGYASECWQDKLDNSHVRRKLRSVQAECLRVVSGAYRTTPCETVCLIKCLPMHLELKKAIAIKQLRTKGSTRILGEDMVTAEYRYWVAVKLHIDARCIVLWQKGRHTYELIPNIQAWLDEPHQRPSRLACSMLTSHGNFQVHLARIGKIPDPNCERCDEIDLLAHRLTVCPTFEGSRTMLQEELQDLLPLTPSRIITALGAKIEALTHFVRG
ncbi:hypothetical protein JTB14_027938 [Gonioctena quinquepunctata]|nr:hypothetical protein JTB14_027938 [Gonioctena quinquepunctata]